MCQHSPSAMESNPTQPNRDSGEAPGPQVTDPKQVSISKHRIGVFVFLCLGCMLQGATYSHWTSFLDQYAQEVKKLTSTQYGIVIGCYGFVIVLIEPIIAKIVSLKPYDDKMLLCLGWAIDGAFCMITSLVHGLAQGFPFFIGSLVVRIFQASGDALGTVMLSIVIGSELNEINHIVIPVAETVYGVGVMLGPAISGVLFDSGGFPVPFLVVGSTLVLASILAMCSFPKSSASAEETASESIDIMSACKFPVIVNVLCTMNAFILVSSNEATLALRLNSKFGLGASESGLLFVFGGGFYALTGLLFGFLSKKVSDPRYFVLLGHCLSLVALVLQGPLIPIRQTETHVIWAQILLGAGTGPVFVCSYIQSLNYLSKGKETRGTYVALSPFIDPAISLGCMIGPVMAGTIRHYYSYEAVIAVNVAQTVIYTILLIVTMSSYCCRSTEVKP